MGICGVIAEPRPPQSGSKAAGFARVLGITTTDLAYLAEALLSGARAIPVSGVRERGEHGMHCQVIVPVRGLCEHADRVANVLTAWEIRWDGDALGQRAPHSKVI
jgi:hypothetical protein